MIDAKNNFRGKYRDLLCRACEEENETQQHILEKYTTLHTEEGTNPTMDEVFQENIKTLKHAAYKIRNTMDKLYEIHEKHCSPQAACDQAACD